MRDFDEMTMKEYVACNIDDLNDELGKIDSEIIEDDGNLILIYRNNEVETIPDTIDKWSVDSLLWEFAKLIING